LTVAVATDVLVPSAWMLLLLSATVVTSPADAGFVWTIVVEPVPPVVEVSVALIVQNPVTAVAV
jgi:hypothetical protein